MLEEDEKSGHQSALEKCKLYTKLGDFNLALAEAEKEFRVRPANIDVNQALAAVSYHLQKADAARGYIKTALRTGSRDPELLQTAAKVGV
jgi:Flp pilus assembly protein TadD